MRNDKIDLQSYHRKYPSAERCNINNLIPIKWSKTTF